MTNRAPAIRPDRPARSEASRQDLHFNLWLERNLTHLLSQLGAAFDEASAPAGRDPRLSTRTSSRPSS